MAYIIVPLRNGERVGYCEPVAVHLKIRGTTTLYIRVRPVDMGDPVALGREKEKFESSREQQHVGLRTGYKL